jgi:hypothetical protein
MQRNKSVGAPENGRLRACRNIAPIAPDRRLLAAGGESGWRKGAVDIGQCMDGRAKVR